MNVIRWIATPSKTIIWMRKRKTHNNIDVQNLRCYDEWKLCDNKSSAKTSKHRNKTNDKYHVDSVANAIKTSDIELNEISVRKLDSLLRSYFDDKSEQNILLKTEKNNQEKWRQFDFAILSWRTLSMFSRKSMFNV